MAGHVAATASGLWRSFDECGCFSGSTFPFTCTHPLSSVCARRTTTVNDQP